MTEWVDFKTIKSHVSMQMVLGHYGIKLGKSGSELRGQCPFHKGEKKNFQVNPEKNVFNCFSDDCGAHGNVLDFVAQMENCSVRDAALKLQEWFQIEAANDKPKDYVRAKDRKQEKGKDKLAARKKAGECAADEDDNDAGDEDTDDDEEDDQVDDRKVAARIRSEAEPGDADEPEEGSGEEAVINLPLRFKLHGIDPAHVYLKQRGIKKETAEVFGAGFFPGKGVMQGRVVIPIHNEKGELVAYAGRWPGESGWPADKDKYEFPVGFKKTHAVYNLHRVKKEAGPVIVVEGFFGTWKVDQALSGHVSGLPCVVASMGASLSDEQVELLAEYFDHVILMRDGDKAGREGTEKDLARLSRKVYVKVIDLPDGKQPDKLSSEQIRQVLGFE